MREIRVAVAVLLIAGCAEAQKDKGVKLEVHAIDTKHAKHGDKVELTWRKG